MNSGPSGSRRSRSWSGTGLGTVAVGACAACCAGPLLVILGGIGVASAVAAIWIPALIVVSVPAGISGLVLHRRRTDRARLTVATPVSLGMPVRMRQPEPSPEAPGRHSVDVDKADGAATVSRRC